MNELIDPGVASRILGMKRQYMLDEMAAGRLDIGHVKHSRKRSRHNVYYIYRAKLAAHLGRPMDYVWPEEQE